MVRGTIDNTERRGSAMEFAHENAGDVVVAKLAGRLDSSSASTAEEQLTPLIANSAPRLVIDLSKLEYISSAGLRVLLLVARKVQQAQGKLALFGLAPGVRDVFSISGFDTIFAVRDDSAAAIAAVR
jgi:stage II sporulation protein AA (anti-sigma F factor antagonist)